MTSNSSAPPTFTAAAQPSAIGGQTVIVGERRYTGLPLGQTLGIVADPFGELEEEVISENTGSIVGYANLPMVHEGEAVLHIAC